MSTKTVGIYVRVSRKGDREDEKFHSPREQAERAEALARAKGYAVGPVYEDIDVSGATAPAERPAMGRLLRDIEAGELAGIAAYALDRLSREPAHGDALVKRVTKAGGVLLTPDIPDAIDTPTGEFTFGMLLQVAKLYRSQAGARFASAKEHAIANGIVTTNRDAVGYIRNAQRRYEPDPDVAPIVRQVFERRAAGAGPTELAELLERHGIRTSQGSATWSKPAVQNLLKSRTYLGELRSGSYVNPNAHEPIVDLPTWKAAQPDGTAVQRRRRHQGYLLAGLLRCASCGYTMQGTVTSRGKHVYRCGGRHAGGLCPARARIDADVVERAVADELFRRVRLSWEKRAARVDLTPLQEVYDAAERRLAQVLSPAAQDAAGDAWPDTVKARRAERDAAAAALGAAKAKAGDTDAGALKRRLDLGRHWHDELGLEDLAAGGSSTVVFIGPEAKRQLIASEFPAIAVAPDKTLDFDPDTSGLSRRGYNRQARLNPLGEHAFGHTEGEA